MPQWDGVARTFLRSQRRIDPGRQELTLACLARRGHRAPCLLRRDYWCALFLLLSIRACTPCPCTLLGWIPNCVPDSGHVYLINRKCPRCRPAGEDVSSGAAGSEAALFLLARSAVGAALGRAGMACGSGWPCCWLANSAWTSGGMLSGHIVPCMVCGLKAAHRAAIGR